jgi:hypothetical protein
MKSQDLMGEVGRFLSIPVSADIRPVLFASMIPVHISWAHDGFCSQRSYQKFAFAADFVAKL